MDNNRCTLKGGDAGGCGMRHSDRSHRWPSVSRPCVGKTSQAFGHVLASLTPISGVMVDACCRREGRPGRNRRPGGSGKHSLDRRSSVRPVSVARSPAGPDPVPLNLPWDISLGRQHAKIRTSSPVRRVSQATVVRFHGALGSLRSIT